MTGSTFRVLCVTPDTPELYGASRSLMLLLEKWDEAGIPYTLCTLRPGALHSYMCETGYDPRFIFAAGEENWRVKTSKFARALALVSETIAAARRVKRHIRETGATALYVNTVTYISPILAGYWARVPTVVHMREIPSIIKRGRLRQRLKWWNLGKSRAQFIANSKSSRQSLLKLGVNESSIELIYNGVDLKEYDPALLCRQEARKQIGLSEDIPLLVTVARPTADKGGEELLRAAAIVRKAVSNARWIVVGGPLEISYFRDTLEPLKRELGLDGMCSFVGVVPDIRPYLSAADVVVVASREETFGRVNIEAMALEKAVAATAVGGIPEVIADGETGLLAKPLSPESLAAKILQLLRDKDLRQTLGQAGRKRAVEMFSREAYVAAVTRLLREAASGK